MLLLAALASSAEALDFRLRWRPSAGPGITGYKLHVRQQDTDFGTPLPVGLPALGSDGTMSATYPALQVGPAYCFAVSAVVANGQESQRSNEICKCTADAQCDDDNPCTADSCAAGSCRNTPIADGTACPDASRCNGDETCQSGSCRRGPALVCRDGDPCTRDSCNPTTGCVFTPTNTCASCTSDAQCNDDNPCTTDACAAGACRNTAVADGTACPDGNRCNGNETCRRGSCTDGPALVCTDGNACTRDSCNPSTGCVFTPTNDCPSCLSDQECDDGNPCTSDTCTSGACRNTAVANGTACGDGNRCNGNETCQGGTCTAGGSLTCTDGNVCTRDACSPSTGCVFTPIGGCQACATSTQCDDGNPCTTDSCAAQGRCTHFLISGCSRCTADGQCDDNNPCTSDRCQTGRCQSTPRPPGASCSDGDPCNGEETCQGGRCKATGFPCDDRDACTADLCDPVEGCTHVASETCETCQGRPRGEIAANWIAFVPAPGGERLAAMGVLDPAGPIDPPSTGALLEFADSSGNVVYRVSIPPEGFKASPSGRFFRLNTRLRQLRLDGLKRLDMMVTPDELVRVFLRAKQKKFGAEFPKAYTWTLQLGDQCGVGDCFLHPRHPKCR